MYTAQDRPELSGQHQPYDRRYSYASEQSQVYGSARAHYEPPRPLEPRPTLHSSLSDTTNLQRRQEPLHPAGRPPESRGPGPSLPGLRDIFSPGPANSTSSSYRNSWQAPSQSSAVQQSNNRATYPSTSSAQPPVILEPHTKADRDHRVRSFEVPMHQTSTESGYHTQPQPVTLSPYSPYPSDYVHSPNGRYDRGTAGPHISNGALSSYTTTASESSPLRHSSATFDHYPHAGLVGRPGSAVENQKKYIGVKDVPGEGAYHCYEGGYRIPTQVDGEQVNPAWGLTKANKPRKRLALACLDCREKKIKCEPGLASCLQCEKAKRPCRRSTAHQTQSETTSNANWSPGASSHSRKGASISDPTPTVTQESEFEGTSKRRSREDPSPPTVPSKKQRSVSPSTVVARDSLQPSREEPTSAAAPIPTMLPEHTRKVFTTLEDDPFLTHRDLTLHLLDLYFAHFNNATYCLYPRHHFLEWLETSRDKCQNERMVLYAMLAMGSVYADESVAGFGKQCARTAMDAQYSQVGRMNMCMVQSKILLGLYSFARGDYTAAWEISGSAIRAATYLRLHTEGGCLDSSASAGLPRFEFSLSGTQLAECKRRTFWSVFFMDRLSQAPMIVLKPEDVFVRLPCTEEMYERSIPSEAPFLNNNIIDPVKALLTPASPLAPMAWHALVAAVWGDVLDFIARAPHRAELSYRESYEAFYVDISNRLHGWLTRLPDHLQYTETNLARAIQHGYAGTYVSMHALYHLSSMKLNRCLRHAWAPDAIKRNIRAAHEHGHHMLQIMRGLQVARRDIVPPGISGQKGDDYTFSTPFVGYATLAAVDIVSAGAPDSQLATTLDEIRSGLSGLQELSRFWNAAKNQFRACETRFYQIQNILTNPARARSGAWLGREWGLEKSLDSECGTEDDCIYGLGDNTGYFDAFKDDGEHAKAATGGLRIA